MQVKRIQRQRSKGWKTPANTTYVGRPTKWGNPFKLINDMIYCDASHRRKGLDPWVQTDGMIYTKQEGLAQAITLYENWIYGLFRYGVIPKKFMFDDIQELKGKNLACWCPLDQPCHAGILLKIANKTI